MYLWKASLDIFKHYEKNFLLNITQNKKYSSHCYNVAAYGIVQLI